MEISDIHAGTKTQEYSSEEAEQEEEGKTEATTEVPRGQESE